MEFLPFFKKSENQKVKHPLLDNLEVYIKREDKIHPIISGNKYRKLKYNLAEARRLGKKTIVTFGGAHSNHIAATAEAGFLCGFQTVGIIRGEEHRYTSENLPTLRFSKKCGMNFEFITRSRYKNKADEAFRAEIESRYEDPYFLGEGGTNALGVKGCLEILDAADHDFDIICCAVGTGGTISGIVEQSMPHQQVLGFSALKENKEVRDTIRTFTNKNNWTLFDEDHFGGYAKVSPELITFINSFYEITKIPLDPIYTGKMMFEVFDFIKNGYLCQGKKILLIHTGGLQGISGMNIYLKNNNQPLIAV